jgi:hypothetical protein
VCPSFNLLNNYHIFLLFSHTFCANTKYIKHKNFNMRNIMHENPRNHILNIQIKYKVIWIIIIFNIQMRVHNYHEKEASARGKGRAGPVICLLRTAGGKGRVGPPSTGEYLRWPGASAMGGDRGEPALVRRPWVAGGASYGRRQVLLQEMCGKEITGFFLY